MAEPRDPEKQDVETLKRRGRRRLVGSIALVLVAVIVLPMVFDAEPKRVPPVSVTIPSEDDPAFTPKVVPTAPAAAPAAAPDPAAKAVPAPKPDPAPKAEAKSELAAPAKPEAKAEAKAASKAAPAAAPPNAERKRAEVALGGGEYVIPVGAFSTEEKLKNVTARLATAKIPYYTETVAVANGTATRVRAGPYPSPEAAGQALKKLRSLGFKPGKVTTRS